MKDVALFLFALALATVVAVGALRQRSFMRNRKMGYVPSTQGLVIWGTIIAAALLRAATVAFVNYLL